LQQLALEAHAWPTPTHVAGAQRGTPTLSCLHVSSVSQLPLQQSHEALHDIVLSLQTSPSGLHPMGLRQTPTVFGAVMTQVTGLPEPPGSPVDPQQSLSLRQMSPTRWHPLAGWQMRTPVAPYGAQRRLQHAPPQAGTPASSTETPPSAPAPAQSMPSTTPQLAGPDGGCPHTPTVCPDAIVQMPLQQLAACVHTSPGCTQKDEFSEHSPFEQRPEQQSPFEAHWFPAVRQELLRGTHLPEAQLPPQQSPLAVQAWLSEMHESAPHFPPLHVRLQQSVPCAHPVPAAPHCPRPPVHAWFVSQSFEQQSRPVLHDAPRTPQRVPASSPPSASVGAEAAPPQP
jgi:hypothetical protein